MTLYQSANTRVYLVSTLDKQPQVLITELVKWSFSSSKGTPIMVRICLQRLAPQALLAAFIIFSAMAGYLGIVTTVSRIVR